MDNNILIFLPGIKQSYEMQFFSKLQESLLSKGLKPIFLGLKIEVPNDDLKVIRIPWRIRGLKDNIVDSPPQHKYLFSDKQICKREVEWNSSLVEDIIYPNVKSGISYFEKVYLAILSTYKPKLIILWGGEFSCQLILRNLAQKFGIPVHFMERGIIPGTIFYDKRGIFYNSSIGKDFDISDISRKISCQYEGLLKNLFNDYRKDNNSWWPQPKRQNLHQLRERIGIKKNQKIIFFPGQVDEDTSNFIFSHKFSKSSDAFNWFLNQFIDNQDFYILGKHHPKSKSDILMYRTSTQTNYSWLEDISIKDCLELSDYVCLVNSTVAIEAMIYQKPVLELGRSFFTGKNITYEISDHNQAQQSISRWIAMENYSSMQTNFLQFMTYMLQNSLFAFNEKISDLNIRSTKDLALEISTTLTGIKTPDISSSLDDFFESYMFLNNDYFLLNKKYIDLRFRTDKYKSFIPQKIYNKIKTLVS